MKEKDEEDNKEKKEEQLNFLNDLTGLNSEQNKKKLTTINSLIKEDENKLKSVNSILMEDSDYDPSILTEDEENKEYDSSLPTIIYNIKDYCFIFALLASSWFNYNFLSLPYIILGIILSYCLFSNTKKAYIFKSYSQYFGLIYSIMALVNKILLIVLTKKENKYIVEHKNIFINLGIKILLDKEEKVYLVATVVGDCLVILFSIISTVISKLFIDDNLNENINKKIPENEMYHLIIKHLLINYFLILGLAIFNTSILSLIYLFLMNFLLFLVSKHSDVKILSIVFKIINIFIYAFIIIQIFFINFFNTYLFRDSLSSKDKEYSPFTQFGINFLPDKSKGLGKILPHMVSYIFAIISMISFAVSNNRITFYMIDDIPKEQNIEEENEEISNNIIKILLIKIKEYFASPNFILHICRVFGIAYLYFFRNFFGIVIFIWLLFTFLFLYVDSNKNLTYAALITLLLSLFCLHISNIDGYFESQNKIFSIFEVYHFCLKKIDSRLKYYLHYFCCNLFYLSILLFIYSLYESDQKKIKKEKKKMNKPKIQNIHESQNDEINTEQNKDKTVQKIDLEENLIEISSDKDSNTKSEEENLNITNGDNLDENKMRERRVTQQIISKKDEKDDSKIIPPPTIKINDELRKKITLLNIITKTFLKHIDKISLVVMYFVAIKSINIIHSVLVIIFMIQLLFPRLIEVIAHYLIIITQILYFIEFMMDILKYYSTPNENLTKLFLNYDKDKETSVEIFIYGIVYCFYIQYTLYNNEVYKNIVLDDTIKLSYYIEIKCLYHPTLKNVLFFMGRIIVEIYIWILISLFIFFDSYFEISLLFEIKLIIFLVIVFQFLISIQKSEKHQISLLLNWIFLIYSSVNTILAYGYQIICLQIFKNDNSDSSDQPENTDNSGSSFSYYLPSIGFSEYPEELLYLKFLPHFVCNFISILFIWEMKRIVLKSNNIFNDLLKQDTKIEIQIGEKEEKEKADKEDEDNEVVAANEQYENNKNEMSVLNLSYYSFNIILIFTKFYW